MAEAMSSSSSSRSCTPPPQPPTNTMDSDSNPSTTGECPAVPQAKMAELGEGASGLQPGVENQIDKLLQKQRNELMYELRRLQHGDRPVTGQGNKEAVEEFFVRASQSDPVDTQEQRPENVVVEVNALVERRPVSSLLQSTRFRRSLETALRGALSTVTTRPRVPRPQPRQQTDTPAVPTPPTLSGLQEFARDHSGNAPQTTAVHNVIPESIREESVVHHQLAPVAERIAPAVNVPLAQQRVAHAQEWVQQIQHPNEQGSQPNVWDHLEESQRQEFVEDISELVQRQLVTGTLEGNFRNVLESRMRNRLQQSGSDGRRVQQVIQSLPPSQHIRNDFSDLGIMGPGQLDVNSDEMSVISATAAVAIPYAQSNVALSRELQSLKSQMKEMMNMMKLQFDMTMDVQRAVRQEVAAAMSHSNDDSNSAAATAAPPLRSVPVNDTICLICTESTVDTVLYQCGHMCVCHSCGMQLRQRRAHCPVCRAPIKDIIRAFKCNSE